MSEAVVDQLEVIGIQQHQRAAIDTAGLGWRGQLGADPGGELAAIEAVGQPIDGGEDLQLHVGMLQTLAAEQQIEHHRRAK